MKVLVDGQLIEYTDQGAGQVILLLHGWGTDSSSLKGLADSLVGSYRVIRLDFPGFGGSPAPQADWFVGDYAALVGEFIKKIDVAPYAIMGHSFGGRVIIKGIATHAYTAEKLVLMGSAGVKPAQSAKKQVFKAVAKVGKAATSLPGMGSVRKKLRERLYSVAGSTDYLKSGELQKTFLNTINEDLLPLVPSITQPTLMLWGEDDHDTPVADAQKIKAQLKNAELIVIEDAGHYVFIDQPAAVQDALGRFL